MGITRNDDGSIATVPTALLDLVPIFGITGVHYISIQALIERLGEARCNALAEYAESLAGLTFREYAGMLAEGWYSETPIGPVIDLLEKLDGRITFRAVVAQRLGQTDAQLAAMLSGFYLTASGLRKAAPRS